MLTGYLDVCDRRRIAGWAFDPETPDRHVTLIVAADDRIVARVLADAFRVDLAEKGIGKGRCSFSLDPEAYLPPLQRTLITVRREGDGAPLPGSPVAIETPTAFADMRESVSRAIVAIRDEADFADRLAFLAAQMEILRDLHARGENRDPHSGRHALPFTMASREGREALDEAPLRALVIDVAMPRPERDAGSNAILSHMRSLQRLGYAVSFASADLARDEGRLAADAIPCLGRPWYESIEAVLSRHAGLFHLVYLHRAAIALRYGALVRHHQPHARLVFSVADLHFLRLARQAKVEERPELAAGSRQMRDIEQWAARRADAVLTHSSVEAALLGKLVAPRKVHVVPWVVAPRPTDMPFADRRGMAFIGHYAHRPNVDAALWLLDHVMPLIRRDGAPIPCLLVGTAMPETLRARARDDVEAIGAVGDLADIFDRVRVTVAPLAYGAGIKGKVLDSLAAGIPCVCTPIAAEGLDLPAILMDQIATDPGGIAANVRRLHEGAALNARCAEAGLAFIETFASEARVDEAMLTAVGGGL